MMFSDYGTVRKMHFQTWKAMWHKQTDAQRDADTQRDRDRERMTETEIGRGREGERERGREGERVQNSTIQSGQ